MKIKELQRKISKYLETHSNEDEVIVDIINGDIQFLENNYNQQHQNKKNEKTKKRKLGASWSVELREDFEDYMKSLAEIEEYRREHPIKSRLLTLWENRPVILGGRYY